MVYAALKLWSWVTDSGTLPSSRLWKCGRLRAAIYSRNGDFYFPSHSSSAKSPLVEFVFKTTLKKKHL